MAETVRTAACRCGRLTARCTDAPVRVSVCHCFDCQRRSGSAFAVQARFPADLVEISGERSAFTTVGDSGGSATFWFCPACGSTIAYRTDGLPDLTAIPLGAFADPGFPSPEYSVYESRRHAWVTVAGDGIDHYD